MYAVTSSTSSWQESSASGGIEVGRRDDQADVAEGLREVAEQLAVGRLDLLGQEAEVVRVAGELVEERLCAVDLAGLRQARDEPERAEHEGALLADQAVGVDALLVAVAQDQPALREVAGDRVERRAHARVVGRQEADERHEQHRRVELVAVERLRVGLALLA